jgi:glycosyltransferase involved in cell wall biosynthesis
MGAAMSLAINTRIVAFQMGGQQRAAAEVAKRLEAASEIRPSRPLGGVEGHLWEQFVLPVRAHGRLLWSPSATGPLSYPRQVVTVHDMAFVDVPECFSASFRRLYAALTPALMRRVAKVVTVSEFSRLRILERVAIDPDKVIVIGNGVSDQFRIQDPAAIARTRAALQLPGRYFLINTTSRRKNAARALRAWRAALPFLPDDLWLIVSGSCDRTRVTGEAEALDAAPRTRFIGHVAEENLAPLIGAAEAFLFPSLYEGFGIPILEAMACATPVLTSDATATREVADGKALLIDPHDETSIGRGIVALATDASLRARLSAIGPPHAAKFTWEDVANRYRALFDNLEAAAQGASRDAAGLPKREFSVPKAARGLIGAVVPQQRKRRDREDEKVE